MWLLIGLGILFGVIGVFVALAIIFPARSVRPEPIPPRIDSFDVHPRHVCRNDHVTATWRGDGDGGTLIAIIPAGSDPFFSQVLDSSNLPEGSSTFRAATLGSFTVELMLSRGTGTDRRTTTRSVNIVVHDSPNDVIRLSVQPTLSLVPPAGWSGRRVFYSDPALNPDDWSTRITVAGFQYRDAGGREIIVTWRGIELGTVSPTEPLRANTIEVTVAGEWDLFAPAIPGDSDLDRLLPEIVIELLPRCFPR